MRTGGIGLKVGVGVVVAMVLGVGGITPAGAAPGDHDPTFGGGDGFLVADPSPSFDPLYGVDVQADGRIVAVGRTGGLGGRWIVLRYQVGGVLDPTFSGDGRAFIDFSPRDDSAFDVAVQPDGAIVVVGMADRSQRFAMARLTSGGVLDSSFSGDGKVTRNTGPNGLDAAQDVMVLGDGRIRAAGIASDDAAVYGYDQDGTSDSTWGGDGLATASFGARSFAIDVEAAAGGAVVVAGTTSGAGPAADRSVAARFTAAGVLDPTFSGDGRWSQNLVTGYEDLTSVVVRDDDGLFLAGEVNGQVSLVRLTAAGTLDTTFGGGDGRVVPTLAGNYEWVSDMVETDDPGIYAFVGGIGGGGGRALVGRFEEDGTFDNTFNDNGWNTFNPTPGFDMAADLAIEDGRVVGVGPASDDTRAIVFRVKRNEDF